MRILVAGATAALGSQLVPRLLDGVHDVVGMTRSASKRAALRALGVGTVVAGALGLDRDGLLISMMALEIADGQIQGVSSIVNPGKLRHIGPVGDMRAVLKRRDDRPA